MNEKVCREIVEFAKKRLNEEFGTNPDISLEVTDENESLVRHILLRFTYTRSQRLRVLDAQRDYE